MSSLQALVLIVNQLKGALPANIGVTLPNLQYLLFGANEFSAPIPTSLCNSTKLRILDLDENHFVGSIPTNLGNLLDLYKLHLS